MAPQQSTNYEWSIQIYEPIGAILIQKTTGMVVISDNKSVSHLILGKRS